MKIKFYRVDYIRKSDIHVVYMQSFALFHEYDKYQSVIVSFSLCSVNNDKFPLGNSISEEFHQTGKC